MFFEKIRSFFRSRWDHLRTDRSLQLFLALSLVTLFPALYYGQFLLRAGFLLFFAWMLVLNQLFNSDLGKIRRLVQEGQTADPRPPHLIFFHLQLSSGVVSRTVFRLRLFLAINVCLLLLNNPLWLPLVDAVLGFLFWFALASSEELYLMRRDGPAAAPVGSTAGAGFRTGAEQLLNHVQKNPKTYTFAMGVGAALGYAGKSVADGIVEVRVQREVNEHRIGLEVIAEAQKLELQEKHNRQLQEQLRDSWKTQLELDLAKQRELNRLEVAKQLELNRLDLAKQRELVQIHAARGDIDVATASKLSRTLLDEACQRFGSTEPKASDPFPFKPVAGESALGPSRPPSSDLFIPLPLSCEASPFFSLSQWKPSFFKVLK